MSPGTIVNDVDTPKYFVEVAKHMIKYILSHWIFFVIHHCYFIHACMRSVIIYGKLTMCLSCGRWRQRAPDLPGLGGCGSVGKIMENANARE